MVFLHGYYYIPRLTPGRTTHKRGANRPTRAQESYFKWSIIRVTSINNWDTVINKDFFQDLMKGKKFTKCKWIKAPNVLVKQYSRQQ